MVSKAKSSKIIHLVHGLVKRRGHGALREAEGELNYNRGYLTNLKSSGDARMSVFLELADYLEIPAWKLIKEATGRLEKDRGPGAWLQAPTEQPPIVREVRKAVQSVQPRDTPPGREEQLIAQLEELDDQRYSRPSEALTALGNLAHEVTTRIAALHLGVAASCYRRLFAFPEAIACLATAREFADQNRDLRSRGDLHQRALYVLTATGFPNCAQYEAERAALLFIRLADRQKIGESLIDQAFCLAKLKRFLESTEVYGAAEHYFDSLPLRYQVACYQGRGAMLARVGRTEEAQHYLELAWHVAKPSEHSLLIGKVAWMRGMIMNSVDEEASIRALQEAIENLSQEHPIDAVLASVDLARIYVREGRLSQACEVATEMRGFVFREPLSRIPAAQKALRDWIKVGETARGLTLKNLDLVARSINEGRASYLRSVAQQSGSGQPIRTRSGA